MTTIIFNQDYKNITSPQIYLKICESALIGDIKSKPESHRYDLLSANETGICFNRLDANDSKKAYSLLKTDMIKLIDYIRTKEKISRSQLKQFMQNELSSSAFILQSPTIALLTEAEIIYLAN